MKNKGKGFRAITLILVLVLCFNMTAFAGMHADSYYEDELDRGLENVACIDISKPYLIFNFSGILDNGTSMTITAGGGGDGESWMDNRSTAVITINGGNSKLYCTIVGDYNNFFYCMNCDENGNTINCDYILQTTNNRINVYDATFGSLGTLKCISYQDNRSN